MRLEGTILSIERDRSEEGRWRQSVIGYKVPQREVAVRVHRRGSEPVAGHLFVATDPSGCSMHTILDKLNDPEERFLAYDVAGDSRLIAKRWILSIDMLDGEQAAVELATHGNPPVDVVVYLSDGTVVKGGVSYLMPPGRERPIDLLNLTRGFLPIQTSEGLTLVNLDHVIEWRP